MRFLFLGTSEPFSGWDTGELEESSADAGEGSTPTTLTVPLSLTFTGF